MILFFLVKCGSAYGLSESDDAEQAKAENKEHGSIREESFLVFTHAEPVFSHISSASTAGSARSCDELCGAGLPKGPG
jgi:hypothetical protein